MRIEILKHMEIIGMVSAEQHGSTVGRSTVSQLLEQQMTILDILENRDNVEICYLYFAKAYDK